MQDYLVNWENRRASDSCFYGTENGGLYPQKYWNKEAQNTELLLTCSASDLVF